MSNHLMNRVLHVVTTAKGCSAYAKMLLPAEKDDSEAATSHLWNIGIDLMGCELPPASMLLAAKQALQNQSLPPCKLSLFVEKSCPIPSPSHPSIDIILCDGVLSAELPPLQAVADCPSASLCVGFDLLQRKKIDAFLSAGDTGAMLACATLHLPMLRGVTRPALLTELKTKNKPLTLLDVGANASCRPEHLVQFALLGSTFHCSKGASQPSSLPQVGLLNIGVEQHKGPSGLKSALHCLQDTAFSSHFHFVGNVEASQIFDGEIDVLVCDGFSGNILLKTAEATANFILQQSEHELRRACWQGSASFLHHMRMQSDHAEHGGALLCGTDSLVIKCHGRSEEKAIARAIERAVVLLQQNFLSRFCSLFHSSQIGWPPAR